MNLTADRQSAGVLFITTYRIIFLPLVPSMLICLLWLAVSVLMWFVLILFVFVLLLCTEVARDEKESQATADAKSAAFFVRSVFFAVRAQYLDSFFSIDFLISLRRSTLSLCCR